MTHGVAIGVDIGGTKLAAGLVAADGTVIDRRRRVTPAHDADAIVDETVAVATELADAHALEAVPVGVGAAALLDLDGVVRDAPNLAWADYPLRDRLAERLSGPVTVDNDANAAAWGEFACGAGREARAALVMLTIGTGVGGGLVLGGRLVRGGSGLGAEFGHIVVAEGGPRCACGNNGCLEALASGTSIGRRATERRTAGTVPDDSPLHRHEQLSGKAVTVAAHDGDPTAREVIDEAGFWLGVGIASLVNALDPEIVVVGGGAMQAGDLLLDPARRAFADRLVGRGHRTVPPVVRAGLADEGGLVGAALLALDPQPQPS